MCKIRLFLFPFDKGATYEKKVLLKLLSIKISDSLNQTCGQKAAAGAVLCWKPGLKATSCDLQAPSCGLQADFINYLYLFCAISNPTSSTRSVPWVSFQVKLREPKNPFPFKKVYSYVIPMSF